MPNVGTASLDLEIDRSKLAKSITDAVDKTSTQVGKKMASVGKKMTTFVTLPIVAGFGAAVKAASDLSESVNKTDVVFGKSAKVIHNFSKSSAKDLGISKRAAEEASGTFGNLFVSMKIGQQPAADMSKRLVQLAADLASFNNASPEEALEALRSGLVGETEPLRRFGVNLNDAALRAEALNLGLVKTTKEVLPPAARAQAAYSLILQQTTTAQGDFARTSDGLANRSRILKAQLEDTAASMGEKLIPVALKVAEVGNSMLTTFGELPASAQNFALLSAVALAALGPVLSVIGNVILAVGKLKTAYADIGAGGFAGIALLGAAIGLTAKGFLDAQRNAEQMAESIREIVKPNDIDSLNEAVAKASEQFAQATDDMRGYQGALGALRAGIGNVIQTLTPLKNKVQDNSAELKASEAVYEEVIRAQTHYRENVDTLRNTLGLTEKETLNLANRTGVDLTKAFADVVPPLTESYKAAQNATATSESLADAQEVLADKTAKVEERLDAFKSALDGALGVQLDAEAASSRYQEAIDKLSESLAENGHTYDLNTEKGRANAALRRDLISAAGDEVIALARAAEETGVDTLQKQALIDKLNSLKGTFPGLVSTIDGYIATVQSIPQEAVTRVTADTSEAISKMNGLAGAFRAMAQGKTVVYVPFKGFVAKAKGGLLDFFAHGGMRENHVAQIAPAGAWRMWAEPETGGEAYIPLAQSKRARSLQILEAVAKRFGVTLIDYARGAVLDPFHNLHHVVQLDVSDVLKAGFLGGPGGGNIVAVGRQMQQMGFRVGEHPAFGGVRGRHVPNSYHYRGRAVDVNWPGRDEASRLDRLAAWIRATVRPITELLWRTKGHYDHLHLAMQRGGILHSKPFDRGGVLGPGWNTLYNGTGGFESLVRDDGGAVGADALARAVVGALVESGLTVEVDGDKLGQVVSKRLRGRRIARQG